MVFVERRLYMTTITIVERPFLDSAPSLALDELQGIEVVLAGRPEVITVGSKKNPLSGFVFEDPYFFVLIKDLLDTCIHMNKHSAVTWLRGFDPDTLIAFAAEICQYNEVSLQLSYK